MVAHVGQLLLPQPRERNLDRVLHGEAVRQPEVNQTLPENRLQVACDVAVCGRFLLISILVSDWMDNQTVLTELVTKVVDTQRSQHDCKHKQNQYLRP